MLILIQGYGTRRQEQLQRAIVSSAIAKLPKEGIGVRELNISKVRIETYKEKEGKPEVVYIAKGIQEQEEIGVYLEEMGVKVISYEIERMHYRPQRVPGNKENTNVYRLTEKIKRDRIQKYNPRKYKRVSFKQLQHRGYKVEVEDVYKFDYDVELEMHYKKGQVAYARNKKELQEIINTYLVYQKGCLENTKKKEDRKREEIKKLEQEIEDIKTYYKDILERHQSNLRLLDEEYNKGIR